MVIWIPISAKYWITDFWNCVRNFPDMKHTIASIRPITGSLVAKALSVGYWTTMEWWPTRNANNSLRVLLNHKISLLTAITLLELRLFLVFSITQVFTTYDWQQVSIKLNSTIDTIRCKLQPLRVVLISRIYNSNLLRDNWKFHT